MLSFLTLPTRGSTAQAAAVIDYFKRFESGSGSVPRLNVTLRPGLRLVLPGFSFSSSPAPSSFDAWVQSGRLCHRYDPDQTFGRIIVQLRRPLPNAIDRLLAKIDLSSDRETRAVRYAYLPALTGDGERVPRWRPKYFLETWLGHWTSEKCYRERKDEFRLSHPAERERKLALVDAASEKQRETWLNALTSRIQSLAQALKGLRPRVDSGDYLLFSGGRLQIDHYRERAVEQLKRDQRRAARPAFRDRFLTGYVFPPVPSFRGAEALEGWSFDEFLDSLCDTISGAIVRGRVQNKLVLVLRDKAEVARVLRHDPRAMTGPELRQQLQDNWPDLESLLLRFHE